MSARAQRSDEPDSLSQRIAPEWLQPDLCVRSDLTEESAWLEFSDSTGLSPASVWASDYEEDLTLQSKTAAAKELEQVTEGRDDESTAINVSRRVRILDESQVLTDEASFATVTVNEPIEQAVVKRPEQAESKVGESSLIDTRPAVRLLDESQILSGEASFATAMSDEPLRMSTYSPLSEFLVKTHLNLTQLMLASLLLVLVIAVTTFLFLRLTTGKAALNSPSTINSESQTSPVEAVPTTVETKALTTFDSSDPGPVSKPQEQLRGAAASSRQEELKLKGASETERRTSPENPSSVIVRRAAASKRSDVKNSRSETVVGKREVPSSTTEAAAERLKDEPKVPPVTGGGERPRKVTP